MRIRRATSNDADALRAIYCDPKVLPYITDDGLKADTFDFSMIAGSPIAVFIIASDEKGDAGTFLFYPVNTVMYELHTAFLPGRRGKDVVEAARLAREYIFNETPCRKVITYVPFDNMPAYVMARKCGMVVEGLIRRSYLRGGELLDQYILGISKEGN
jgi:RimJ/RimL family protein N-acetyltransferase